MSNASSYTPNAQLGIILGQSGSVTTVAGTAVHSVGSGEDEIAHYIKCMDDATVVLRNKHYNNGARIDNTVRLTAGLPLYIAYTHILETGTTPNTYDWGVSAGSFR